MQLRHGTKAGYQSYNLPPAEARPEQSASVLDLAFARGSEQTEDSVNLETHPSELKQFVDVFWQRKWAIVLFMAAFMSVALLYTRTATPLYTSIAEILIDPRKKQLTDGEVIPTGLGSSALGADAALVESQVAIMKSESVLGRLIKSEKLDQDPEFVGNRSPSMIDRMATAFQAILYSDAQAYSRSNYDKAKRKLEDRVQIKRLGNTYVVTIRSRSQIPDKAALISNKIAQIYIDESKNYSANSTIEAANDLEVRLRGLRVAAERSANAVETYRRENGLIGAQNLLIVEQQLREINNRISATQGEVEASRARLEEARLAYSELRAGNGAAFQSPVANNLYSRLADIASQESALSVTLLPQHPSRQELAVQRKSIETALQTELSRIMRRYEDAFNVALRSEAALQRQLKSLQSQAADSNSRSVKLRELERDAALNHDIYEKFAARAKQINQQVGLQTDNTRILSVAYPSSRPSHPKGILIVPASAILGLIAGILFVWVTHIFFVRQPISMAGRFDARQNQAANSALAKY